MSSVYLDLLSAYMGVYHDRKTKEKIRGCKGIIRGRIDGLCRHCSQPGNDEKTEIVVETGEKVIFEYGDVAYPFMGE